MVSVIEATLLDESVRKDGFLSSSLDPVIKDCRARHKDWFDLAEGLNRLSMRLLWSLKPDKNNNQQMLVTLLYGRGLSAYQAVILLSERGLILEARYDLRAMLEITFAIAASANSKEFCARYIDDDQHRLLKLINACLRLSPELMKFHGIDEEDLKKQKADAQHAIKERGSRALEVRDIAEAGGMSGHYETAYRLLSLSAHSNVRDLDYHIVSNAEETEIEKLGWGPHTSKSADPVMQACDYLLIAANRVLHIFERPELSNQYGALHRRFEHLLGKIDEPKMARRKRVR